MNIGFARFDENWPASRGNQYLTGNNDQIFPEGSQVLWKFRTQRRLYNPVGVNVRLYVVSIDNHLYCLDMADGSVIRARRDPAFGFYGTTTIAAGKIFYGNRKGFCAR